jgi:hypothetical protein
VAYVNPPLAQHVTDTGGTEGRLPATVLSLARSTERALEDAEAERLEARNAALVARHTQAVVERESSNRDAEAYRVARYAARVHRQHLEGWRNRK